MNRTKIKIILLLIIVLLALNLSSCGNKKEQSNLYTNEALAFTLEMPSTWDGRYQVETGGNVADFYYGEGEYATHLFSIKRYYGMMFEDEDVAKSEGNEKILDKLYDVTYTINYNFKLEENDKGKEPADDEKVYMSKLKGIIKSFKSTLESDVSSEEKPYNFRYIGSPFFETYIPNYYKAVKNENSLMTWDITLKDTVVGKISMLPYGSGIPYEMNDMAYIDYKKSEQLNREIRIAMTKKYIEQYNFFIVMNSLKFLPGPTNVVDVMSDIKNKSGAVGEALHGKILEVIKQNGRVTAIKFERTFQNEEEKENAKVPEGVYTYSVDPDVKVVPLVAPEYVKYGDYTFTYGADAYFNSDEYENYDSKMYYISIDGHQVVKGMVAKLPEEDVKEKE